MSINLNTWLTDKEAAARLGVAPRTLDREIERGHLHPQRRPVPGRKPERVWDPEEIQSKMPAPPARVIPPSSTALAELSGPSNLPASLNGNGLIPPEAQMAIIARLVEMVADARQTPKPWITLTEASETTGLTRKLLRRLIANGSLEGIRDVAIKVHRESLETLDVSSEMVKPEKKSRARK